MKNKLLVQTKHEYNPKQRIILLLILAPFFLCLFPLALIWCGSKLDQWLRLPSILYGPANLVLAVLLIATGLVFGLWSNNSLFTLGRGTPVPLMATQQLIVQPPYTYCRNPMTLGTILMYAGVAVLFGSIGAVILVLFGTALLLTYIKRIEEKEMELRFGQEYLAYKARTPFLIPRFRNRS